MSNDEKTLDNKIRRMILNLIINYPGVSYSKLKDIFELTDSNLRYHLNYLEKNGRISQGSDDRIKNYYPHPSNVKTLNIPDGIIESYKLSQEQRRLINIIKENPGIHQKKLIKTSGIKQTTAIRILNSLQDMNLIKNNKIQKNVCYEYVPDVEMRFTLIKGLIIKLLRREIDEDTFLRMKKKMDQKNYHQ
jgi:predicted transcriptional regulator